MNSNFPTKDYRNNSILKVSNNPNMSLMPSKFQSADDNSSFSNGRNLFFRTYGKNTINNNVDLTNFLNKTGKYKCEINCNHFSCKSNTISSNSGKYIKTQSSDQHIQKLKNQAIGKGTMAKKEDNNYINSFSTSNNTNNNTVKQALQRNRNKGYVVPPKVTSKISCYQQKSISSAFSDNDNTYTEANQDLCDYVIKFNDNNLDSNSINQVQLQNDVEDLFYSIAEYDKILGSNYINKSEIIDAIEASGNIAVILKIYYTDQNDLENKVDIWIHENNNGISNTINLHEFKTFFTKEYHLEFTSQ